MAAPKYDFSGWATKHDVKCSDGRIIQEGAFKHQDKKRFPLVWNHRHGELSDILGFADVEYRPEGMFAHCSFNDTEDGLLAKKLVTHGDLASLSIYANKLEQDGRKVTHGMIREVSLVLAGANPEASIESVDLAHGEFYEDDDDNSGGIGVRIYSGEFIELAHSDIPNDKEGKPMAEDKKDPPKTERTVQEIVDSMDEEQRGVMDAIIAQAVQDVIDAAEAEHSDQDDNDNQEDDEEEGITMKHNVFEGQEKDDKRGKTLSHSDFVNICKNGKRAGTLKAAFDEFFESNAELSHADLPTYGINNVDYLFPDARTINGTPDFISRDMGWVRTVMGGIHNTPFSRIKSIHADITEDDARARGYIKGKLKKEEVFTLLKRVTTPARVYKKQKMDKDDIDDITDFDVLVWLKAEMRMMLDEELARAYLVGDGRMSDSDDKIKEENIRPIWTDADLYTIKADVNMAADAKADDVAKEFERVCIKSRKNYKGSGSPTLFTTEDLLTDMLLREDTIGRKMYSSVSELAIALRVKEIITVPVMEGLIRTRSDGTSVKLMGIIVNLQDYNVGADKGGAVAMFEDFDIDYNQQKYLIETKCSGALIKPYSAIAIEWVPTSSGGSGTTP